jgi:hypothetical protein
MNDLLPYELSKEGKKKKIREIIWKTFMVTSHSTTTKCGCSSLVLVH